MLSNFELWLVDKLQERLEFSATSTCSALEFELWRRLLEELGKICYRSLTTSVCTQHEHIFQPGCISVSQIN